MVIMLVRHQQLGGHIHCRVFTRNGVSSTWQKAGNLVFTEQEWPEIKYTFQHGGAEVIPEDETRSQY